MEFFVRTIARQARLFDGTTLETNTGYTKSPTTTFLRTFKGTPEDAVGRFSIRNLSSPDAERPMVVWFRVVGNPTAGESRVELRSAAAGDTPDADYGPLDLLLETYPLAKSWSTPVIMGATDRLWVFHEDTGDEGATVEFRSIDYVAAAQLGFLVNLTSSSTAASCCSQTELEVTETQEIPVVAGHLVVLVNPAADTAVELPDPVDLMPGRDSITVVRVGGTTEAVQVITGNPLVKVNGLAGVTATLYNLRTAGEAVTYLPVAGGYIRAFGEQAYGEKTETTNPISMTAAKAGTAYVVDAATVLDNQTDLPPDANSKQGVRYALLNSDTQRHQLKPQVGSRLNGVVNGVHYHQPGTVAVVEKAGTGANYMVYGGGNQGAVISSGANITLTAAQCKSGITTVVMTGGAGQDLTLPPVAAVENGAIIAVYAPSAGTKDIIPDGTDKINNANSPTTLAATKAMLIINFGPTPQWATILTA